MSMENKVEKNLSASKNNTKTYIRRYCSFIIFSPIMTQEQVLKHFQDNIKSLIVKCGGNVERFQSFGVHPLSFFMKKNKKGFFFQFYFNLPDNDSLLSNNNLLLTRLNHRIVSNILRSKVLYVDHQDFRFESLDKFQVQNQE